MTLPSTKSKVIFVAGLGVGMFVTAMSLTPANSVVGDKYFSMAAAGVILVATAGLARYVIVRKEIAHARTLNLKNLWSKDKQ